MTVMTQTIPTARELTLVNSSQSVVLKIMPNNLISCLEFMLSHHISFEVEYNKEDTKASISPSLTSLKQNYAEIHTPKQNAVNIANKVYEKYVNVISETPLPNIPIIAAEYGVSTQTLKNLFLKTYGQSLFRAYMQARMEKSAKLLRQGYNANTVSQMIGYGDKSAIKFNKMFKVFFGITPKKYQVANRNK